MTMQPRLRQYVRQFFIAGLCVCSFGCEVDYRVRADFYYLNDSAFDVVLRTYSAGTGAKMNLVKEILIRSKEEQKVQVDDIGPENVECEEFREPAIQSDSLSISYSNGAVSTFKPSTPSSNNPLLIGNYTSQKIAQNYCEFRFTIK